MDIQLRLLQIIFNELSHCWNISNIIRLYNFEILLKSWMIHHFNLLRIDRYIEN